MNVRAVTNEETRRRAIFGLSIWYYRLENDMTQKEVAAKANISQSYYSMLERGLCTPGIKAIHRISNVLNLDPRKVVNLFKDL